MLKFKRGEIWFLSNGKDILTRLILNEKYRYNLVKLSPAWLSPSIISKEYWTKLC